MFMKNLKSLVHEAHTELKTTTPSLKKSHLYEAIASFCGFKSYAAFQSADVQQIVNSEQACQHCFNRILKIGFDVGDALLISKRTEKLLEELNNIDLDDVWYFYCHASYEEKLASSSMLEALKALINKDNMDARLIGMVLVTEILAEFEEDPDNRSGEHWQNKRLTGSLLNNMQEEVADNYLKIQCYTEFLEFLYSVFLNSRTIILPSPLALKRFNGKFNIGTNRGWTSYFSDAPYLVTDAFEYFEHYRDTNTSPIPSDLFLDWYKAEVMLNPNKEMVGDIIAQASSHEEKWFWYYVGLLYDFDVTEDAHIAINADTGEEYDGYGPAVVGGYTGISLPSISESSKAEMKIAVTSILS